MTEYFEYLSKQDDLLDIFADNIPVNNNIKKDVPNGKSKEIVEKKECLIEPSSSQEKMEKDESNNSIERTETEDKREEIKEGLVPEKKVEDKEKDKEGKNSETTEKEEKDEKDNNSNTKKSFQYMMPSFMMSTFNFSVTDKTIPNRANKIKEKNISEENKKNNELSTSADTSENIAKNKSEDNTHKKMEIEGNLMEKENENLEENKNELSFNHEHRGKEKSLNLEKINGVWKNVEIANDNDIIFVENEENNGFKKSEENNTLQENEVSNKETNQNQVLEPKLQIEEAEKKDENKENINDENLTQERDMGEENQFLGKKIREEDPLDQDIQTESSLKKQERQELQLLDLVQKHNYGHVFNLVLKNCLWNEEENEEDAGIIIRNLVKEAGFQKIMSIVLAIGSLLGEQIMFVNKNKTKQISMPDDQNETYNNNPEDNNLNNKEQNEIRTSSQPEVMKINNEQDFVNNNRRNDYVPYERNEENRREIERPRERERINEVNNNEKPNEDMRIIHLDRVNENTIQNKLMSIEQKEMQKKEYEETIQLEEHNREHHYNNNYNSNTNLFQVAPAKEYKRHIRFEVKRPRKRYEDDENYNPYEDLMMQKNGRRSEDRFVVIDEQGRLKKRYSDGEESEEEEDDYGYRKRFRPPPRKIEKMRNNPLKLAPTYKNLFTITNCQEQLKKQLIQIINSSIRHKHHDELADYLNESLRNKKFDTKGFKVETRGRKKKGERIEKNPDQGDGWNNFS